jgi:hypothetical protein
MQAEESQAEMRAAESGDAEARRRREDIALREERYAMHAETMEALQEAQKEQAAELARKEAIRVSRFYEDQLKANKREMESQITALKAQLAVKSEDAEQHMAQVTELIAELKEDRQMQRIEELGKKLITCMQNENIGEVEDILKDKRLREIAKIQDRNGMTPLHQASRCVNPEWVQKLLEAHPDAVNYRTFSTSNPKRWTALQCLADTPRNNKDNEESVLKEEQLMEVCKSLIENMSNDALFNQTETGGQTFLHTMASRGHLKAIEYVVLPHLDGLWGREELGEPPN